MPSHLINSEAVQIWSAGVCRPNPGLGAYAAVLLDERGQISDVDGWLPDTTNNCMDLLAVCAALEQLRQPRQVIITTDCQYVTKGAQFDLPHWLKSGWRKAKGGAVANRKLWERFIAAADGHALTWNWISKRDQHGFSERANRLADQAHKEARRLAA